MTRYNSLCLLLAILNANCTTTPKASDSVRPSETTTATATRSTLPEQFECTVVLGLAVTGEWFGAGFEEAVGDSHWQAVLRPHTFVEQWANPEDPVWSQAPISPCELRADRPDRVVFFAADWKYHDESEWITGLTAAVNVLRIKFSQARVIELFSMLRAPNNVSCGDPKSVVEPYVDSAIDNVSAQFGGLVRPGPKFEVPSCTVFDKGGPHFTQEGRVEVAKMIAAHYSTQSRQSLF